MKAKILIGYAVLGNLLFACGNEELAYKQTDNNNESVEKLISDFYKKIHPDTRFSDNLFKITNISTESFIIPDSIKSEVRSSSLVESYDIHTVTVDFGETSGYVILSDTPEINEVFYYTEAGCIADTAFISPLRDIVSNAPTIASEIIVNGHDAESRASEINIQPLVRFQWHQGKPFNNYATYCTCEKCAAEGNHMPMGCTNIALGQTIATIKHFKGTFYGNRDIDFDIFPNTAREFNESLSLSVAHFLQEVALNCQTKFECDGSSSTIYSAAHYLIDLGYKCDVVKGDLDRSRVCKYLQAGFPHLLRGISEKGGHMWIIDGIVETNGTYNFHCNWGQGYSKSDGWVLEDYYTDRMSGTSFNKTNYQLYIGGLVTGE